jgi:hypothetical protein
VCGSLTASVRSLSVGKKVTLRVVVRDKAGKRMKGVRVTVRGAGIVAGGRTNGKGILVVAIVATRPGIVTIRAGAGCAKRVGSVGVFQPPVTG